MSTAGIFTVRELLTLDLPSVPLVDKVLWQGDNVFIVGNEKAGKSILSLQLAFALSSGQPFLGEYDVKKVCKVLYVQAEGKLGETQKRINSMLKVNDCDQENLHIAYFPSLALDTEEGFLSFVQLLGERSLKPDVIFLDPLYHSMDGSMTDELDSRRMTRRLRKLGDILGVTIIVVHHTHKPIRTKEGKVIDEGDDSIFGSFVWKAWADHTLLFRFNKAQQLRILSCNTQRSGDVLEYDELILIDKPYLSFNRKLESTRPYELCVRMALEDSKTEGVTRDALVEKTGLSMTSVEKSLTKLIRAEEAVKCVEKRPVRYWSKVHRKDPPKA